MRSDPHRAANRRNWDERARVHAASEFYGLDRYRDDAVHLSDVVAFDRARVGDVAGRRLLHLQCHIGTDTLSWARLGAEVTGLDFSGASIAVARRLFADTGTPGRFVEADVYDAAEVLDGPFDVVYTGVGALPWLDDLAAWARVVAGLLAPSGRLHLTEGHPMLETIDDQDGHDGLRLRYPYFRSATPVRWDEDFTYTDNPLGPISSGEHYEWPHSVSEVLTSLLDAGLRLTSFEEHTGIFWAALPDMMHEDGMWRLPPEQRDLLPLMYSLSARHG